MSTQTETTSQQELSDEEFAAQFGVIEHLTTEELTEFDEETLARLQDVHTAKASDDLRWVLETIAENFGEPEDGAYDTENLAWFVRDAAAVVRKSTSDGLTSDQADLLLELEGSLREWVNTYNTRDYDDPFLISFADDVESLRSACAA